MPKRVRELISRKKYREAGDIINSLIAKERKNDELWYLKGIILLKLGEYDAAMESFERALWIKRKPEYFRLKGMANFELFELKDAIENFECAISIDRNDSVSHFFLALCYMLLDDNKCRGHLKKAYKISKKRTTELIRNFYEVFFSKNPFVSKVAKEAMEDKIGGIQG